MMISMFDDKVILIGCLILAGILGAVLGSFLNCTAYRIARKESFVKGRSHCPSCGHDLGVLDLIPIFSWVFLGGKCRYCKSKISIRYFIAEVLMALVSILCLIHTDLSVLYIRDMILICCLFCLSMVDLEIFEIPDGLLIIAAAAWFAALPFQTQLLTRLWQGVLAGVVVGGAILLISLLCDKILKRDTMGGGDIKLLAVCGLYLGLVRSLFMLILACIIGIVVALITRNRGSDPDKNELCEEDEEEAEPRGHIPFGPAISLSTFLMLLYGNTFAQWYLGLF